MSDKSVPLQFPGLLKSPRQIRIAIAGFFFISGFGFSSWASRIPTLQQHLRLNEAQLGAVLLAMPLGLILTLPLTGLLIARFSSRNMMLFGAILLNLILVVLGLVDQTWQLAVLLFCFGASRNQLSISVNAQSIGVQSLYSKSILNTFHGIWSVAGFAGAAFGSLMISISIPPAYHFTLVCLLLTGLALILFPASLPEPENRQATRTGFVLPDRSLMKFGLMSFSSMACEGTLYDWSGIYFQKVVQAPKEFTAAGFVVFMVAMTAGRFSGDYVVNRFGRKAVLSTSGALMSAGLLLAALWPTVLTAGLGFMMVGLGVSCVVPLVIAIAGQSATLGNTGSVIAAVSTIAYAGFLIVPPVVGFLAEALNLQWSFGLMSLLGLGLMALVSRVNPPAG
ncbi:MFS transporter [Larkinella soli]|uniref:MFS transporter n=1 Tax=Larkinella soli TaxID=1770527 RepID=UPI0019D1E608|nr:MFS transporter [Larkinella soli]